MLELYYNYLKPQLFAFQIQQMIITKNRGQKAIQAQAPESQFSYQPQQPTSGESVKVALRLRPLNNLQLSRGDTNILRPNDKTTCQLLQKNGQPQKNFRFTSVVSEKTHQAELYQQLNIDQFLEAALAGYSVTIFAYGQTGSGKTYTMAGVEEKFNQQVFKSDQNDGIIPRAIKNLWKITQKGSDKYSIKASFTEIYNEQIKDLLNPTSGVLHCRWNPANGFFVQDLVIVDCTSIEDLIAVLNEGIKNRKSGSHQLNKDSSRSHSLMTIYVVSEMNGEGRSVKRYGKISFVDLAGSERLKESKSQGEMAKETANINKSLFTLGKVIKALSDRKVKAPYIPYRDSKLTMLLMDSLGGTSKALMVACVSPSSAYADQTLSTLNYATRTMNIKNKPVVQMEEKDQIIYSLARQRDLLRLQNQYLREQIQKISKGKVVIPKQEPKKKELPPLNKGTKQASGKPLSVSKVQEQSRVEMGDKSMQRTEIQVSLNKIVQQYQFQMARLQHENQQLRNARQVSEKNCMIAGNDNNALQIKLQNLQQLFIKNSTSKKNINQEYINCNLMAQNKMIRNKISQIQDQIFEIKSSHNIQASNQNENYQEKEVRVINKNLKDRLQFLKKRELELMGLLSKKK